MSDRVDTAGAGERLRERDADYTPEEAIAIVTSVSPGRYHTMGAALEAAPDAIEHLRRLGYELRRIGDDWPSPRQQIARAVDDSGFPATLNAPSTPPER